MSNILRPSDRSRYSGGIRFGGELDRTPEAVREDVKGLILSIKALEPGFNDIAFDDPLFSDDSGRPSPVNLDSLDALDLSLTIVDHFGLDDDKFDEVMSSDAGFTQFRTVADIADLIVAQLENQPAGPGNPEASQPRKEVTA